MRRKVLIIDDSNTDAFRLIKVLLNAGYDISHIDNPLEALAQMSTINPELILLDVEMPELDGYRTLERLKKIPGFEKIPVIIQTGRGEAFEADFAAMFGAKSCLAKPVDSVQLLAALQRELPLAG